MASLSAELATLRALTFRISSTNTAQLPQQVPAIAAALANCRTLLSSTQNSNAKSASASEASVSLHKYRTLLSTLLQHRTAQGRWTAVVLIKATIEVGGWETLQKTLPWVRGLLGILTKPDPPSLKKLSIITLTRIFMLTRDYPTLIREITTPSLPTFVQNGLQLFNAGASTSLQQVILESFNELLPRHPTIFRSYLKQFQPLLANLIAPTPSNKLASSQAPGRKAHTTSATITAAQRLYAQLPCCAPKGASSDEWQKNLKGTISLAHHVADKVFRAVQEEWQSSAREAPSTNNSTLDDDVQDLEPNNLGLPPWSGIFAGSERLTGLLRILRQYLETPTPISVYLNLAAMLDLLSRILSLTLPGPQNQVKINNQVSKEERDNLWSILPDIHVATVDVLLSITDRSKSSTLALDTVLLDQLVWVFGSESKLVQVRTACYAAIATLLGRSGMALPKSSIDSLSPVMRACCEDLLPSELSSNSAKSTGPAKVNGNVKAQTSANADTFLDSSKASYDTIAGLEGLKQAANNLLPALFANIRAQYLSDSMRARLDRTAILTQHKDAMIKSVLNPPPSKKFGKPAASILPLVARTFAAEVDVEGLLKPRMPVIRLGTQDVETADAEEELDDEDMGEELDDEDMREEVQDIEDENHIAYKLDALLESVGGTIQTPQDTAMAEVVPDTNGSDRSKELDVSRISDEDILLKDPTKRPHADEAPASPCKRVRPDEAEQHTMPPVAIVPSRVTRSTFASAEAPATSEFTVTSTASVVPELPTPGDLDEEDVDSDEDDIIPLVLGQDTDDESE